jgi:hypothetical protein
VRQFNHRYSQGDNESIIVLGVTMKVDFEWDPDKEKKNIRKHKVNFEEAG